MLPALLEELLSVIRHAAIGVVIDPMVSRVTDDPSEEIVGFGPTVGFIPVQVPDRTS